MDPDKFISLGNQTSETNNRKRIALILATILLLVAIPSTYFYFSRGGTLPFTKTQLQPKLVQKTTLSNLSQDHPQLFYADLELNPKTNLISKVRQGQVNGDLVPLSDLPATSSAKLTFKLEVVDTNGSLLLSGWFSANKEALKTIKDTYIFRITTQNVKGSRVNLFSVDEQLVWSEIIK